MQDLINPDDLRQHSPLHSASYTITAIGDLRALEAMDRVEGDGDPLLTINQDYRNPVVSGPHRLEDEFQELHAADLSVIRRHVIWWGRFRDRS
jgi:hypothetical protein